MAAQHFEFLRELRFRWYVASVGIACNQAQGFLLAATGDQDRIGLCQRCDRPIEVIRPGDCMFFEPGEDHWHGAAPDRFVTHSAMLEVDDAGNSVTWGEHVTNQEYSQQHG